MTARLNRLGGRFIVIDGPDGAGKSTQLRLLADWLRSGGLDVRETRDPGGTAIGDRIRSILLDRSCKEMSVQCELMLYMASRAQLADEVIRPALKRRQCVLCDRYVSATIAYQGAGGADPAAIRAVAEVATGGLWPDLTVILDLPAEAGLERVSGARAADRMEEKTLDFHRRVRELFLQQASEHPSRFTIVDGTGDVDAVQQRLRQAIVDWRWAG